MHGADGVGDGRKALCAGAARGANAGNGSSRAQGEGRGNVAEMWEEGSADGKERLEAYELAQSGAHLVCTLMARSRYILLRMIVQIR